METLEKYNLLNVIEDSIRILNSYDEFDCFSKQKVAVELESVFRVINACHLYFPKSSKTIYSVH